MHVVCTRLVLCAASRRLRGAICCRRRAAVSPTPSPPPTGRVAVAADADNSFYLQRQRKKVKQKVCIGHAKCSRPALLLTHCHRRRRRRQRRRRQRQRAADDGVQLVAAIDGETTSEMLTAPVREPPIVTWGIYYTSLWCYASYFTVDLIQGEDTAEELLSRVINDHGAVAGGDVLPLLSGGFVTTSPFSLAILLVCVVFLFGFKGAACSESKQQCSPLL